MNHTVSLTWLGEPSAVYPNIEPLSASLQLHSRHEGQEDSTEVGEPVVLAGTVSSPSTHTWDKLPMFDPVSGQALSYFVVQDEEKLPASYMETSHTLDAQRGKSAITNSYQSTLMDAYKRYAGSELRPPVTMALYQNGTLYHTFQLDGIPDGTPGSNLPREVDEGRVIWPSLPLYDANDDPYTYTVADLIPSGAYFPYIRSVARKSDTSYEFVNTYRSGYLTAIKGWDTGTAPRAPSVTFKLWREVISTSDEFTLPMDAAKYVLMGPEYDAVLHGVAEDENDAHGSEVRPWEYTWRQLPLNGDYDGDPTKPVTYRYFVRELPLEGFVINDTASSSSLNITNVAVNAPVTARKNWGRRARGGRHLVPPLSRPPG